MRAYVNQTLISLLEENRIFPGILGQAAWQIGELVGIDPDAEIEPYCNLGPGRIVPRRFGAFSYSFSALDAQLVIGRYCNIGSGFKVMGSQHPVDWAVMSPFTYAEPLLECVAAYYADRGKTLTRFLPFDPGMHGISIGHDVWIGDDVMIKRGVTVGTGAVIAARAVVTRDVEPYSIVGGIPARVIRHRFSPEIVQDLLASEWWGYGPDVVAALEVRQPEKLRGRLTEALAQGAEPLSLKPVTARAMINAVQPGALS